MQPLVHDDIPRQLTLSDYEDARERLIELSIRAGVPGGHVSFFGTVGAPGVSDLDALVVAPPAVLRRLVVDVEAERAASLNFREILWHPPTLVLPDCVRVVRRLHTFVNLVAEPAMRDQLGDAPNESCTRLLNTLWLQFLLQVATEMIRAPQVSLRMLLLVYKNLEHSTAAFGSGAAKQCWPLPSQILRERVLSGEVPDNLRQIFSRGLDAAMASFDEYWGGPEAPRLARRSTGLRMLSPRRAAIPSARTGVTSVGPMTFLRLHSEAWRLIDAASRGGAGDHVREYTRAARWVEQRHREEGLPYPFIRPWGRPVRGRP